MLRMNSMKNLFVISYLILQTMTFSAYAREIRISVANFEADLNNAIDTADSKTKIIMPAGTFIMQNEVLIDRPGISLIGQGPEKTVLTFKNQKAGPQGILATKDRITFQGFAVEDSFGNGIKVFGAKYVTFRNLRVTWTRGPSPLNGPYGIYPVLTENTLIENCDVSGSSDAGIYVGQSKNIIVRKNIAHGNVAGIEIENSDDADVYENEAHHNTAGILVFNLPDLVKKEGHRTRIFSNHIHNNNSKNFSSKGTIISLVPKGMGVFLMASLDTEVFNNVIQWHTLTGVGITNYAISERIVRDPTYNPMPKGIQVYGNHFSSHSIGIFDGGRMNFIIKLLSGLAPKDIIYDGISDGTYEGQRPSEKNRICIQGNDSNRGLQFANLHLDHQRPHYPYPGGPVTKSLAEYDCALTRSQDVVLQRAPVEIPSEPGPTEEEILKVCKTQTKGVNWEALNFDCPDLSDYHFFTDSTDPTKSPIEGFSYLLNNQLFTDYAIKHRFIFLPSGQSIKYQAQYALDFPVGSAITKTFSIQEADKPTPTLLETRVLIRRASGWIPLNYSWKAGKAVLNRAGFVRSMTARVDGQGDLALDYHSPNLRQCSSCHFINEKLTPIGPQAKFLNRKNQLESWSQKSFLTGLPDSSEKIPALVEWNDVSKPVDDRAHAYLAINCTHCHNPAGNARNTGLFLQSERKSESVEMGHCKSPVAAGIGTGGNEFDIQPGSAEKSILYYRISHSHLAVKMPQLGRSVNHLEGNELIKDWINQMPAVDCRTEH
jgi:parallel beta-helix repeat protein